MMENSKTVSSIIILIGSGRSGTTLIQRVLNTFQNCIIWGEHDGFLSDIAKSYFTLKESPSLHKFCYNKKIADYKDPSQWQAWMNWFNPSDIDMIYIKFVEQLFNPSTHSKHYIWGFKEIRYSKKDKVLEFLLSLFPNANILIVAREPLNTIESQIMNFYKGRSRFPRVKRLTQIFRIIEISKKWRNENNYFLDLKDRHPNNITLLKYEDILDSPTILNTALEKINLTIGPEQLEVFQFEKGRGTRLDDHSTIYSRWSKMGLIPALIIEFLTGATSKTLGYKRPAILFPATKLSLIAHRLRNA